MTPIERMIASNLNYIQTVAVTVGEETKYRIIQDRTKEHFGCGQWRNTFEKIQQIRSLGILHQFGEYPDCVSKGGLIILVEKGWVTNNLEDVISIFKTRISQLQQVNGAIQDDLEDKKKEIARLNGIIKALKLEMA